MSLLYSVYSVGRWENDNTLVIDTTGLDERAWLDQVGHPRSPMSHIQERHTRLDQHNMQLTVTVDDPTFYTKLWTFMRSELLLDESAGVCGTLCVP